MLGQQLWSVLSTGSLSPPPAGLGSGPHQPSSSAAPEGRLSVQLLGPSSRAMSRAGGLGCWVGGHAKYCTRPGKKPRTPLGGLQWSPEAAPSPQGWQRPLSPSRATRASSNERGWATVENKMTKTLEGDLEHTPQVQE
ncbi:hypothetical protein VULLAG_LOCUS11284 [Vulpes lagopus]